MDGVEKDGTEMFGGWLYLENSVMLEVPKLQAGIVEIKFIFGKEFPPMGKFGYKFSTPAQKLEKLFSLQQQQTVLVTFTLLGPQYLVEPIYGRKSLL